MGVAGNIWRHPAADCTREGIARARAKLEQTLMNMPLNITNDWPPPNEFDRVMIWTTLRDEDEEYKARIINGSWTSKPREMSLAGELAQISISQDSSMLYLQQQLALLKEKVSVYIENAKDPTHWSTLADVPALIRLNLRLPLLPDAMIRGILEQLGIDEELDYGQQHVKTVKHDRLERARSIMKGFEPSDRAHVSRLYRSLLPVGNALDNPSQHIDNDGSKSALPVNTNPSHRSIRASPRHGLGLVEDSLDEIIEDIANIIMLYRTKCAGLIETLNTIEEHVEGLKFDRNCYIASIKDWNVEPKSLAATIYDDCFENSSYHSSQSSDEDDKNDDVVDVDTARTTSMVAKEDLKSRVEFTFDVRHQIHNIYQDVKFGLIDPENALDALRVAIGRPCISNGELSSLLLQHNVPPDIFLIAVPAQEDIFLSGQSKINTLSEDEHRNPNSLHTPEDSRRSSKQVKPAPLTENQIKSPLTPPYEADFFVPNGVTSPVPSDQVSERLFIASQKLANIKSNACNCDDERGGEAQVPHFFYEIEDTDAVRENIASEVNFTPAPTTGPIIAMSSTELMLPTFPAGHARKVSSAAIYTEKKAETSTALVSAKVKFHESLPGPGMMMLDTTNQRSQAIIIAKYAELSIAERNIKKLTSIMPDRLSAIHSKLDSTCDEGVSNRTVVPWERTQCTEEDWKTAYRSSVARPPSDVSDNSEASSSPIDGETKDLFGLPMSTQTARELGGKLGLPKDFILKNIRSSTPHRVSHKRNNRLRSRSTIPLLKRKSRSLPSSRRNRRLRLRLSKSVYSETVLFADDDDDHQSFVKKRIRFAQTGVENIAPDDQATKYSFNMLNLPRYSSHIGDEDLGGTPDATALPAPCPDTSAVAGVSALSNVEEVDTVNPMIPRSGRLSVHLLHCTEPDAINTELLPLKKSPLGKTSPDFLPESDSSRPVPILSNSSFDKDGEMMAELDQLNTLKVREDIERIRHDPTRNAAHLLKLGQWIKTREQQNTDGNLTMVDTTSIQHVSDEAADTLSMDYQAEEPALPNSPPVSPRPKTTALPIPTKELAVPQIPASPRPGFAAIPGPLNCSALPHCPASPRPGFADFPELEDEPADLQVPSSPRPGFARWSESAATSPDFKTGSPEALGKGRRSNNESSPAFPPPYESLYPSIVSRPSSPEYQAHTFFPDGFTPIPLSSCLDAPGVETSPSPEPELCRHISDKEAARCPECPKFKNTELKPSPLRNELYHPEWTSWDIMMYTRKLDNGHFTKVNLSSLVNGYVAVNDVSMDEDFAVKDAHTHKSHRRNESLSTALKQMNLWSSLAQTQSPRSGSGGITSQKESFVPESWVERNRSVPDLAPSSESDEELDIVTQESPTATQLQTLHIDDNGDESNVRLSLLSSAISTTHVASATAATLALMRTGYQSVSNDERSRSVERSSYQQSPLNAARIALMRTSSRSDSNSTISPLAKKFLPRETTHNSTQHDNDEIFPSTQERGRRPAVHAERLTVANKAQNVELFSSKGENIPLPSQSSTSSPAAAPEPLSALSSGSIEPKKAFEQSSSYQPPSLPDIRDRDSFKATKRRQSSSSIPHPPPPRLRRKIASSNNNLWSAHVIHDDDDGEEPRLPERSPPSLWRGLCGASDDVSSHSRRPKKPYPWARNASDTVRLPRSHPLEPISEAYSRNVAMNSELSMSSSSKNISLLPSAIAAPLESPIIKGKKNAILKKCDSMIRKGKPNDWNACSYYVKDPHGWFDVQGGCEARHCSERVLIWQMRRDRQVQKIRLANSRDSDRYFQSSSASSGKSGPTTSLNKLFDKYRGIFPLYSTR